MMKPYQRIRMDRFCYAKAMRKQEKDKTSACITFHTLYLYWDANYHSRKKNG